MISFFLVSQLLKTDMVPLLRYKKIFLKLSLILIIMYVVLKYQNNLLKRRRIRHFQLWTNMFGRRLQHIKYILIWSETDMDLHVLKKGHEAFRENKCVHNNCFVSTDRYMFGNDYRNFDVIVMSAKLIHNTSVPVPEKRFSNQTFIFASSESVDYYTVCNETFDNYFNLTWTYKLNSDVPWLYFGVYDIKGKRVAPKIDVKWITEMEPVPKTVVKKIIGLKKFAVAWFASNCHAKSGREKFVLNLKLELKKYAFELDVVGKCGTRECPIEKEDTCLDALKHYYFYLALENSISVDYVTEKILRPMHHGAVPVVFGGANYSKFLPPHSYINGYKLGPKRTAAKMAGLIMNHTAYLEYFKWRKYYFLKPATKSVCDLCKLLNKGEKRVYDNIREWWNPKYNQTCSQLRKKNTKSRRKRSKFETLLFPSCDMEEVPILKSQKKYN